jgi:hypothetical protein
MCSTSDEAYFSQNAFLNTSINSVSCGSTFHISVWILSPLVLEPPLPCNDWKTVSAFLTAQAALLASFRPKPVMGCACARIKRICTGVFNELRQLLAGLFQLHSGGGRA